MPDRRGSPCRLPQAEGRSHEAISTGDDIEGGIGGGGDNGIGDGIETESSILRSKSSGSFTLAAHVSSNGLSRIDLDDKT